MEEGGNHNQEVLKSISKNTVSFADIGTPVMKDNAGSSSMTVQIQTCNVYGCSSEFSSGDTRLPQAPDLVKIRITGLVASRLELSLEIVAPPAVAQLEDLKFQVVVQSTKWLDSVVVPPFNMELSWSNSKPSALGGFDLVAEETTLSGSNNNNAKNLQACIGECDNDGQCATGLTCFQRDRYEAIPGCKGAGTRGWDYCSGVGGGIVGIVGIVGPGSDNSKTGVDTKAESTIGLGNFELSLNDWSLSIWIRFAQIDGKNLNIPQPIVCGAMNTNYMVDWNPDRFSTSSELRVGPCESPLILMVTLDPGNDQLDPRADVGFLLFSTFTFYLKKTKCFFFFPYFVGTGTRIRILVKYESNVLFFWNTSYGAVF